MSALEAAILAIVSKLDGKPAPSPSPGFIPSPAVPTGLTLQQTITSSSTPSKTGWPEWVYVVAAGGGGSGNISTNGAGGGGGACIQGWVPAASIGAVTIGAGAAGSTNSNYGNRGGDTKIGPIVASGGGAGVNNNNIFVDLPTVIGGPGSGAFSYHTPNSSTSFDTRYAAIPIYLPEPAYGIFPSNWAGPGGVSAGRTAAPNGGGAGGAAGNSGDGQHGIQAPGGGAAYNSGRVGGNCLSPNGTLYTGGANGGGILGGGGAGILGNGIDGSAATNPGGGGLGGGGGGQRNGGTSGAGGNGAVLIYY